MWCYDDTMPRDRGFLKKIMPRRDPGQVRHANNFRFSSPEHHRLVSEAAKQQGLSINAWMVQVTLREAKKQVAAG